MPAYKGTKELRNKKESDLSKYSSQGPLTTDPKMVGKQSMGNFMSIKNISSNNEYSLAKTAHKDFYRKARTPGLGN